MHSNTKNINFFNTISLFNFRKESGIIITNKISKKINEFFDFE